MSILAQMPPLSSLMTPANIVGAVALSASFTWPLLQRRDAILAVQICGSLLFATHYWLLGSPTAAAMCAFGIVQSLAVLLLVRRWQRVAAVGATVAVSLMVTVVTWTGLPSFFSQLGQMGGAAARLQPDVRRLKLCFLVSALFWCAHNLTVMSVFGLMSDAMALSGLTIGLWRMRKARAAGARVLAPAG